MRRKLMAFLAGALLLGGCHVMDGDDMVNHSYDEVETETTEAPAETEAVAEAEEAPVETEAVAEAEEAPVETEAPAETELPEETETESPAVVTVDYAAEELLADPESYEEFIADDSEYRADIVFVTDRTVKDVRLLSLFAKDFTDDGRIIFDASEQYSLEVLTPEKPLVVRVTFMGDIPNVGIAYTDADGEARTYAVEMSGKDSSLSLTDAQLDQ